MSTHSAQTGECIASSSSAASPAVSFQVIAGSYEKLLYGLEASITHTGPELGFRLDPIFIFPAHVSCIKAVAASPTGGKWLATGSADEVIKLWDLRRRKEVGGLMHHEGSITYLHFPSRSHLLSASEDGTLCLFRARDWVILQVLKGHKGRVNSVAVHPSGKLALSVGKDRTLRMWDLMRGKSSASTKLGKEGETVRWSKDGSMFAVQSQATIDIYTTNMNLVHSITHPSRVHDVKFSNRVGGDGETLLVAAEDKMVTVYDVSKKPNALPTIIAEMIGHSNRIKAVDTISIDLPSSTSQNLGRKSTIIACTASSDGKIHLYDLSSIPSSPLDTSHKIKLKPVGEYDTKGTRLTCMTIAEGSNAAGANDTTNTKRKRAGGSGDEEAVETKNARLSGTYAEKREEEEEEDGESGEEDSANSGMES